MEILDKSNYFKALLVLGGKDRKISQNERDIMLKIGTMLGFEKEFCNNAINEILVNKYIIPDPPKFSDAKIAESLIIDGLKLALSDRELNKEEFEYLSSIAEKNGISKNWLKNQIEKELYKDGNSSKADFKIVQYL